MKVSLSGPVIDLAPLRAKLEPETERRFAAAKRDGRAITYDNARYDAVVELLMESGARQGTAKKPLPGVKSQVVLMVDLTAMARGYTVSSERCSIAGVGDVPVSAAWSVFEQSIVRMLATEGEAVRATATTTGRHITALAHAAALARDAECVVPHCHRTKNLQLEHRRPTAEGGPDTLENVMMMCAEHHYLKTHHGWSLVGPRNQWEWVKRRPSGEGGSGYPLDHDEDPHDYVLVGSNSMATSHNATDLINATGVRDQTAASSVTNTVADSLQDRVNGA